MAIRRIDPKAVIKIVSVMDDAVDVEKSDHPSYSSTLDMKHIVLKEGVKPTYFLLKNLNPLQEIKINEAHQVIVPPSVDPVTKVATKARIDYVNRGEMSLKYFEACITECEEDGVVKPISAAELPVVMLQELGAYAMLYAKIGQSLKKT